MLGHLPKGHPAVSKSLKLQAFGDLIFLAPPPASMTNLMCPVLRAKVTEVI